MENSSFLTYNYIKLLSGTCKLEQTKYHNYEQDISNYRSINALLDDCMHIRKGRE